MPKDYNLGIRQHAGCCFDLYVLQQSTDKGAFWGDEIVQKVYGWYYLHGSRWPGGVIKISKFIKQQPAIHLRKS